MDKILPIYIIQLNGLDFVHMPPTSRLRWRDDYH
jgi:hypothetical protein